VIGRSASNPVRQSSCRRACGIGSNFASRAIFSSSLLVRAAHTGRFPISESAADRILRYAGIVGRENVIAGTDCGLGGRVHADLAWAKLRTLVDGR